MTFYVKCGIIFNVNVREFVAKYAIRFDICPTRHLLNNVQKNLIFYVLLGGKNYGKEII